ncbi:hypothetical protein PLICRDRAFT_554507 [Plicaturopsis crispa FD-325 SS-3]|nr:hypothetical protein PLICRDRAFT_554507 [Plicaturopsis crispa FD-325 SS-3]
MSLPPSWLLLTITVRIVTRKDMQTVAKYDYLRLVEPDRWTKTQVPGPRQRRPSVGTRLFLSPDTNTCFVVATTRCRGCAIQTVTCCGAPRSDFLFLVATTRFVFVLLLLSLRLSRPRTVLHSRLTIPKLLWIARLGVSRLTFDLHLIKCALPPSVPAEQYSNFCLDCYLRILKSCRRAVVLGLA